MLVQALRDIAHDGERVIGVDDEQHRIALISLSIGIGQGDIQLIVALQGLRADVAHLRIFQYVAGGRAGGCGMDAINKKAKGQEEIMRLQAGFFH